MTFLATANCNRYVGAEVVFADVDPDTGLMNSEHLEAAIERAGTNRVRAVYPVHLNGQCAALDEIRAIANKHRLWVIEDACHAVGATYRPDTGEAVKIGSGGFCDMAIFSLHPAKTVAMGEGGIITTNDEALFHRILRLRNHGIVRDEFENSDLAYDDGGAPNPWYYEMPELGFNYRASDIHCALGLSQLGKLPRFVARRRELAAHYDNLLTTLAPAVKPIRRVTHCEPAWHLYAVHIDFAAADVSRASVVRQLRKLGIGSQVHFLPVHLQPYYRRRDGDTDLPGAKQYYERCLSLPLFSAMTDDDVDYVVDALASILSR